MYLKGLMYAPYKHSPTFGGDGLTIHYNLQYHATHGHGAHLKSQYHPDGEIIYMTDAQGVLAYILASLRTTFPELPHHAAGISNFLIFWSNPIAAVILFLCLIKLNIRPFLAIAFAILISLMSPQITRQLGGHYALGYAFLIPMILYFLIGLNQSILHNVIRALLLGAILVILGINNPYLIAISGSFLLAFGGIGLLRYLIFKKGKVIHFVLAISVAVVPLFITDGFLSSLDVIEDRTKVPYGFFSNLATMKSIFFPEGSLLNKPLSDLFKSAFQIHEGISYVGIVATLYLLSLPVLLIKQWKTKVTYIQNENYLGIMLLASIAILIFSMGVPFLYFQEFTIAHLGKILQFRAPGRFAWIFYFVITLMASVTISQWIQSQLTKGHHKKAISLGFLIVCLWGFEAHQFLTRGTDDHIHHNAFSKPHLEKHKFSADKLQLTKEKYEGIFLIPTEHGWTDKVLHSGQFQSESNGYKYSIASGLPLINGKLSRMSVSQCLSSMQLLADPLVKKDLLYRLSPEKDILFVTSLVDSLSYPESRLVSLSNEIYRTETHQLSALNIGEFISMDSFHRQSIIERSTLDSLKSFIIYDHMDESGKEGFIGEGARYIQSESEKIISFPLSNSYINDTLELSFWYKIDNKYPGAPYWELHGRNNDELKYRQKLHGLHLMETQDGWMKAVFELPAGENIESVTIHSNYRYPYYIDELLVRRLKDTIVYRNDGGLIVNNYRIKQ